jgi:hypothetical protein
MKKQTQRQFLYSHVEFFPLNVESVGYTLSLKAQMLAVSGNRNSAVP